MAVYLDHNATTPLADPVVEAMLPFLREAFGNPSSRHVFGRAAQAALGKSREQVAALVGAHPSQVVFTSGGTEANNLALKGVAQRLKEGRLAVSPVEHASVLGPARFLGQQGREVEFIPVDEDGRVNAHVLEQRLDQAPARLVSVMWANNETGVLQDVPALAAAVRDRGGLMHSDAVQAAGKVALNFAASGLHLMSVSAHKINGPKGAGALILDKAVDIEPLHHGGGQERGWRNGTENVAGIVGFGAAAELASQTLAQRQSLLKSLRHRLETALVLSVPDSVIFARDAERLANTTFFAVRGVDGEALSLGLDRRGFAVSSGAACGRAHSAPSHVLEAMGIDQGLAQGAIRISLGEQNTENDIDAFVTALRSEVKTLRAMAGGSAWT